jgi:hypothetical protein
LGDFFFLFGVGLWSWLADILSYEELDFIPKPTVFKVGLQHMQQSQVGWYIPISLFAPGF